MSKFNTLRFVVVCTFFVALVGCKAGSSNSSAVTIAPPATTPATLPDPVTPAPPTPTPPLPSIWLAPSFGQAAVSEIRDGVYIATDYVFDDRGANTDALAGGDFTYPSTDAPYKRNAADIVELRTRVDRTTQKLTIGVRLNTLLDPSIPVIAIGLDDASAQNLNVAWPFAAGIKAKGVRYVFTMQKDQVTVTDLTTGAAQNFPLDVQNQLGANDSHFENTFTADVPLSVIGRESVASNEIWTVYVAAGIWSNGAWVSPVPGSPAPYDIGFVEEDFVNWQQNNQAALLATGDITTAGSVIDFREFPERLVTINAGLQSRIYRSPVSYIAGEGIGSWDYYIDENTSFPSGTDHYQGLYLPYILNVPAEYLNSDKAFPLVPLLHGLKGNHLSFVEPYQNGTMTYPALTAMPTGAAGDSFYVAEGTIDVLATIDDMKSNFRVDDDRVILSGVSMGGQGVYSISTHLPDHFAVAVPIIGTGSALAHRDVPIELISEQRFKTERFQGSSGRELIANAFNLPYRAINGAIDPIVNVSWVVQDTERAVGAGNDFRLSLFTNRQHEVVFEHLDATFHQILNRCQLANPPAGCAPDLEETIYFRDINPAKVVFKITPHHYFPALGLIYNKAYWVSGLEIRDLVNTGDSGIITATSFALAHKLKGAPVGLGPEQRTFTPTSDNYIYTGQAQKFVASQPKREMTVTLENLSQAVIDLARAGMNAFSSQGKVAVTTDGAVRVTLKGLAPESSVRLNSQVYSVDSSGAVSIDLADAGNFMIVLP